MAADIRAKSNVCWDAGVYFGYELSRCNSKHRGDPYIIQPPNASLEDLLRTLMRLERFLPMLLDVYYLTTIDPRVVPFMIGLSREHNPRVHASAIRKCPCF